MFEVFFSVSCVSTYIALRWVDGSPVLFQMWDEGQPDFINFDEHCVAMRSYHGE